MTREGQVGIAMATTDDSGRKPWVRPGGAMFATGRWTLVSAIPRRAERGRRRRTRARGTASVVDDTAGRPTRDHGDAHVGRYDSVCSDDDDLAAD